MLCPPEKYSLSASDLTSTITASSSPFCSSPFIVFSKASKHDGTPIALPALGLTHDTSSATPRDTPPP
ncbi:hypothetical protein DHEL01_v204959 [Diaporthe helianthi]|uniref:Uncharacterized protein n=1 Tax=Diaporthe helianthi TaxID=158607 RepID=A0A2P5I2F9_DIAHE|nr:hypothetical protein DHEL01_v204959 [Diaporthe helianthi]